jgi:hypothetical protein
MNVPLAEQESQKNDLLYPGPGRIFLCTNLIIGPTRAPLDYPLPPEFSGAQPLCRIRLANDFPAVLVARMIPLDNQNREHIKNSREVFPILAPDFRLARKVCCVPLIDYTRSAAVS